MFHALFESFQCCTIPSKHLYVRLLQMMMIWRIPFCILLIYAYLFLKSVEKWHILKDFDPFPVQFLTHTPAVPLITKMVSDLGECLWQSQKRCFKTVLVRVATKHIKRLRKLNESQWDTMRLCQTQWHSAKLSKTQYNLTMLSKIQQDLADSVTPSKTE